MAALRSDPRYAHLPFVLLSLFGSDHAAVADWPHQPDAIGLKPIRALKLAKLVDQVLNEGMGEGVPRPTAGVLPDERHRPGGV